METSSVTFSIFFQDGLTSLYLAAREGHEDIVRVLLTSGTDPNVKTMVIKMFTHICKYKKLLNLLFQNYKC